MRKIRAGVQFLGWLAVISLLVGFYSPSRAQNAAQASARILAVDATIFPQISLLVQLRHADGSLPQPADLGLLEVLEDEQPQVVQADATRFAASSIIVLDFGQGITTPGSSGAPLGEEMRQAALAFRQTGIQDGDQVGLLALTPSGVVQLQTLTSEAAAFETALNQLTAAETSEPTNGLAGVQTALELLPDAGLRQVLYFSMGVQQNRELLEPVSALAVGRGVVVHTLFFNPDLSQPAETLTALAADTGGVFVPYRAAASISELVSALETARQGYRISFRSTSNSRAVRNLTLRWSDLQGGSANVQASYQVALQAPQVLVDTPLEGSLLVRQPLLDEAGALSVQPLQVRAHVEWQDNLPRRVSEAQLWVNGRLVGIVPIQPDGQLAYDYDIRTLAAGQEHTLKLQILVRDELGLEGLSQARNLRINLGAAPEVEPAAACSGLAGTELVVCQAANQPLLFWVLAGAALLLSGLLLVVGFSALRRPARRQTTQTKASQRYEPLERETITRLLSPVDNQVGAYLEVAGGDPALQGKFLPLYLNTPTLIGRSAHEAEIVFQASDERHLVSRVHCEFREQNGVYRVRDLGSTQGTYVNGMRLEGNGEGEVLFDGDQIELAPAERGGMLLIFRMASSVSTLN